MKSEIVSAAAAALQFAFSDENFLKVLLCTDILNIRRDMKPENVLVGRTDRMKENVLHVVDFGLQPQRNDVTALDDNERFPTSRFGKTIH